uniref:Uncharacterized protein n=1 Tax=Timema cristinae TaxID=61476 RepID=A0A7R9DS19_TIMCR|nr:unnamed protein product [Timema cristinae]
MRFPTRSMIPSSTRTARVVDMSARGWTPIRSPVRRIYTCGQSVDPRFLGARGVPDSVTNLTDTEDIVASPEEPDSSANPQGGQQTNNKRQKLEDIVQVLKKHKGS